jgi:hydrogenase-4 component F
VLATGTSASAPNRGLVRTLPISGALLVLGLFAVTGSPPFGLFLSEFILLRAAIATGHPWIAGTMLLFLAAIFIGMATMILGMALGEPPPGTAPVRENRWLLIGPLVLASAVLLLGVYIPAPLQDVLARAAAALGGSVP